MSNPVARLQHVQAPKDWDSDDLVVDKQMMHRFDNKHICISHPLLTGQVLIALVWILGEYYICLREMRSIDLILNGANHWKLRCCYWDGRMAYCLQTLAMICLKSLLGDNQLQLPGTYLRFFWTRIPSPLLDRLVLDGTIGGMMLDTELLHSTGNFAHRPWIFWPLQAFCPLSPN